MILFLNKVYRQHFVNAGGILSEFQPKKVDFQYKKNTCLTLEKCQNQKGLFHILLYCNKPVYYNNLKITIF